MNKKIMVVEDDRTLSETVAYNLAKHGYEVKAIRDGSLALDAIEAFNPDLIVLDIMLPGMDGFEITRNVRKKRNVPILMLTARDDEIDRVLGLEIGADDYMTKPFSMREFLARVKAMLRRERLIREEVGAKPEGFSEMFESGNLVIDNTRHEILLNGEILMMKPKEYALLLFFVQHKGQVLSRSLILERVWGWDFVGGTRTVDVHIRWLRSKIEVNASEPVRIVTVRGAGYRFEG